MAYNDYTGSTQAKTALLTNIKGMLSEIYTTYVAEIEAARDGEATLLAQIDDIQANITTVTTEVTNARDGEANLLAQIDAIQDSVLAVTAANGSLVSSNDSTPGFLDGKLIAGDGITFTVGNEGANETLTISIVDEAVETNYQQFTSSGTWTAPSSLKTIKVTVIGGGGSASNNVSQRGCGGGGGGSAIKYLDVTPGEEYTVVIGAGGAGIATGSGNTNGNAGGTSSFAGSGITTVQATGGSGGVRGVGAPGGIGSGGDINSRGGTGVDSALNSSSPINTGGGTFLCGRVDSATTPLYGAGSGGRYDDIGSPAGADGIVIIEY